MTSFATYIDESGCEGGDHGKGASEWFALSAVVVPARHHAPFLALVDDFRREYNRSMAWRFKFTQLDPKRKIRICQKMAEFGNCRITTIFVHKPSLSDDRLKRSHNHLYFYFGKFLIERISWICRDWHGLQPHGNGLTTITFSERKKFPYEDFAKYIEGLRDKDPNSRMEWSHIDESLIGSVPHSDSNGCILADAVASATCLALEYTEFDITDPRPIVCLRPAFYRPGGNYKNNSLKLFPVQAERVVSGDQRCDWLRHYFSWR